jgi:signal transduction histidine kinase
MLPSFDLASVPCKLNEASCASNVCRYSPLLASPAGASLTYEFSSQTNRNEIRKGHCSSLAQSAMEGTFSRLGGARMKSSYWLSDTIAQRFAMTEILVVALTLALASLIRTFGGVWFQEPLDRSRLPKETADIVRIFEAAPPQVRPALAAAAADDSTHIDWYSAESLAARSLEASSRNARNKVQDTIRAHLHRTVLALGPRVKKPAPQEAAYGRGQSTVPYLAVVQLNDRSWLVFSLKNSKWGIDKPFRWMIGLCLLAIAITIVTVFAARQFSRPVEHLAAAVRKFGMDPQAPPIPETGPKELRQVVRTFNAMQAQIQKFLAYRTMTLAAISHDLRTPLTRIRLRGEFMENPEQQARLFRDVDEMRAMVDGALVFFRDDAVAEATTTFDLPGVLLTIANDCADQKIDVTYTGPAHAVYHGRPFALKRAFTNLVENAIKYGTSPQIELSCEDTVFVVAVRDRGPGIPDDALERVFRPFYRLDKSRNRTVGGVGLGLTVVQAIVHGHGGEIALSNRPGGGVEARVTLPLSVPIGKQLPLAQSV